MVVTPGADSAKSVILEVGDVIAVRLHVYVSSIGYESRGRRRVARWWGR
jgi:hypothetical protein